VTVMSLAQILDKAVDIHRKNLKSIAIFKLAYSLIAVGIILGAAIAIAIIVSLGSLAFFKTSSTTLITSGITLIVILSIIFVIFVSSVVALDSVGIMEFARNGLEDKKILSGYALSFVFKNILKVTGIIASGLLLFLPIAAFWVGIGWFFYRFLSKGILLNIVRFNFANSPVLGIIAVCVFMLLIICSTSWYMTIHIFSIHAVVFQNKTFFKGLSESRRLVKNNFWKILGCNILFSLCVIAIYYSFDSFVVIIGAFILLILKFFNISKDIFIFLQTFWLIASWPVRILQQFFVAPLYMLSISLLYFNQRFKKDGYDLKLRLEKIKLSSIERKMPSGS
jgi:hypothetical protein